MSMIFANHCYELIFDKTGMHHKIMFEGLDRSSIFTDSNRFGGTFEICEDGQRIGKAVFSQTGQFWTLLR